MGTSPVAPRRWLLPVLLLAGLAAVLVAVAAPAAAQQAEVRGDVDWVLADTNNPAQLQRVNVNVSNAAATGNDANRVLFRPPASGWAIDNATSAAPAGWSKWIRGAGNLTCPSCLQFNRTTATAGLAADGPGGAFKQFTIGLSQTGPVNDLSDWTAYAWEFPTSAVGLHPTHDDPAATESADFDIAAKPTGVLEVAIVAPAGATDFFVSPGQTVDVRVTVSNRGSSAIDYRIKVDSSRSDTTVEHPPSSSAEVAHDATSTKATTFPFTFNNELGERTLTFNLTGTPTPVKQTVTVTVQKAPDLVTFTNITAQVLGGVAQPRNITSRTDLLFEPVFSGTTASASTTTSVKATNPNWVANQWAGYRVIMQEGALAGTAGGVGTIASNTADTLTLEGTGLSAAPASGLRFAIFHAQATYAQHQGTNVSALFFNNGEANVTGLEVKLRVVNATTGADVTASFENIRDWKRSSDAFGAAVGAQAGASALVNTSAAMLTDAYKGAWIKITAGVNLNEERTITANTATTFTVSPAFSAEPVSSGATTTRYEVINTTAGGLTVAGGTDVQVRAASGTFTGMNLVGQTVRLLAVPTPAGWALGQERLVKSHTADTLTLWTAWTLPSTETGLPANAAFAVLQNLPHGPFAGGDRIFFLDPKDCTDAPTCLSPNPPDGVYNITLEMRYWDQNTRVGEATLKHIANRTNASFLTVDNTAPGILKVEPSGTPNLQFRRGGGSVVNVTLNITELTPDPDRVRFVVTHGKKTSTGGTGISSCVPEVRASPFPRCPLDDLPLVRQGTTAVWKISHDMAKYEELGQFPVYVLAQDRAGNWANFSLGSWTVRDTELPTAPALPTISPGSGVITLGDNLQVSAEVRDNFRVARAYLRAFHVESGRDVFADDETAVPNVGTGVQGKGLPMTCSSCGVSNSGTWSINTPLPKSGTYRISVYAEDTPETGTSAFNSRSTGQVDVTVTSNFELFFQGTSDTRAGNNLTKAECASLDPATSLPECSQVKPATFRMTADNAAGALETFVFECRVLKGANLTNATGADQCLVRNSNTSANSTVIVTIQTLNGGTDTPDCDESETATLTFDPLVTEPGLTIGADKCKSLHVNVTAPPTARPGELVRVELSMKPKFGSAASSAVLGFEVVEARGVSWEYRVVPAEVSRTTAGAPDPVEVKPTRNRTLELQVRNTGNVETWYTLKVDSVLQSPFATPWTVAFSGQDSRFTVANSSIRLAPAGAANFQNTSRITLTLNPPGDEISAPLPRSTNLLLKVEGPAGMMGISNLPITSTDEHAPTVSTSVGSASVPASITLRQPLSVVAPTIFVDFADIRAFGDANTACNNDTAFPLLAECKFVSGGKMNFEVIAHITSSKNPPDGPDSAVSGIIQARMRLTSPCNLSCPSHPLQDVQLSLETADINDTVHNLTGRNGWYRGYFNITESPARITADLFVFENVANGDQWVLLPAAFQAREDPVKEPRISKIEVLENGTALTKTVNTYRTNFGSPLTVRVTVEDEGGVGNATLLVSREADGPLVVPRIPLIRQSVSGALTRATSAVYEGVFVNTGSFETEQGQYHFAIEARDAMGIQAAQTNEVPFLVEFSDFQKPNLTASLLSGGVAIGSLLEVGLPLSLNLSVLDNGDAIPGSNVEAGSVRVAIRRGTTEVLNTTMTAVAGNLSLFTLAVNQSLINTTGNYTFLFLASDKLDNTALLARSLEIAPNIAPQLAVTSPGVASDGNRYVSTGSPLVVSVTDANVAGGTVTVEFTATGSNTSSSITPQRTSTASGLTLTINVTSDGTVRITVIDELGLTGSLSVSVRVDTTAPTGVAVTLDPLDITAGRVTPATPPFTISPSVRLFVTATDAGSGIANGSIQVSVRAEGGTASTRGVSPSERFTLADVLGSAPAEGRYVVGARALDRAGNGANATEATLTVDSTAPSIGTITPVSPLTVRVTDNRSGVKSVEVEWSATADGAGARTFALTRGTGDSWSGEFPAEARGSAFFLVRATDNVGNAATARCGTALCAVNFGDRPPLVTVTVTSEGRPVQPGGVVRGNVTIGWNAQDPEGAQVLVTVSISGRGEPLIEGASLVSSVAWDTTQERDGATTITVLGDTGAQRNTTTFNVVVRNLVVVPPEPLPPQVDAGVSLLLAFRLDHPSRDVAQATAIVKAGGESDEVQLFDDGTHGDRVARDGIWSASYTPRLSGANTVDVQVTYDDGQESTVANVATFRVAGLAVVQLVQVVPILVVGALVLALGLLGLRRWK